MRLRSEKRIVHILGAQLTANPVDSLPQVTLCTAVARCAHFMNELYRFNEDREAMTFDYPTGDIPKNISLFFRAMSASGANIREY